MARLHPPSAQQVPIICVWQPFRLHKQDTAKRSAQRHTHACPLGVLDCHAVHYLLNHLLLTDMSRELSQWNTSSSLSGLAQSQLFQKTRPRGFCGICYRLSQTSRSVHKTDKTKIIGRHISEPRRGRNSTKYRSFCISHDKQPSTYLHDATSQFDVSPMVLVVPRTVNALQYAY